MCDPRKTDSTEITDLMVCAPWANITYSCLANKVDHTPCCLSRGIPKTCLPFCSGNVTTITFSLFRYRIESFSFCFFFFYVSNNKNIFSLLYFLRCLQYMSDYSSCLLQSYGVLASAPSRIKAPLISSRFAIVEWNPPKVLAETVISYNLHLRKLNSEDDYIVLEKDHPPIIVEDLDSATYYEAFVVAVNAHGKSAPSTRLVFQTKHQVQHQRENAKINFETQFLIQFRYITD